MLIAYHLEAELLHMKRCLFLLALVSLSIGGTGCKLLNAKAAATPPGQQDVRLNCLSLLHDLMSQEKDVSKLLIIKRESQDLNRLVKSISAASAAATKKLEDMAGQAGSGSLDQLSLPKGEVATRKAIASTLTKVLLTASGDDFELGLMLSQAEALEYGWHLAAVAAANEPQPERRHYLTALSEELKNLYHQVISLLRTRTALHKEAPPK